MLARLAVAVLAAIELWLCTVIRPPGLRRSGAPNGWRCRTSAQLCSRRGVFESPFLRVRTLVELVAVARRIKWQT
jgi:hypothetical protein